MINSYYNEGEEEKRHGASNLNGFMAGTRWWRCCVIIIWQPCAPCVTEYRMMNDPLSRPGPAWWIFRPPKGWRTDQQLLERRRPLQFSPSFYHHNSMYTNDDDDDGPAADGHRIFNEDNDVPPPGRPERGKNIRSPIVLFTYQVPRV